MMLTGVLTVLVILLSQTVCRQNEAGTEKAKTEQHGDQDHQETFVTAPSEAVTSSPIAEVNEQTPSLLEELVRDERESEAIELNAPLLTSFIKTLFRVIISPNAP